MSEKNIYQRILGVMADVEYIQKSDKKVNNMYRFVSHDQVTGVIHPALVKHGIVCLPTIKEFKQEGNRTEVILLVKFVNADKPDDFVESLWHGYGIDPSDKGPGKAVSYAFKYAILKTFCLETGDDPDNEQETKFDPNVKPKETKKKEVKAEAPFDEEKAYDEFCAQYPDVDIKEIKDFFSVCESHWKKGFAMVFERYRNHERFIEEFNRWKSK